MTADSKLGDGFLEAKMTTQENGKTSLQMGTEYQDEKRAVQTRTLDEKRAVQTRTFTKWMNVYLNRREPPVEVLDLFRDIQDGRILMILLEELTGCKLLYRFRSSSHRIFRLNNISKALTFLDDRHVKLLGIDASAVADGVPSVILNLIWNIILHFQVKEVTGGLHRRLSSSLSSLSSDPDPAPASGPKYSGKTIKTLLQWVQRSTTQFGVDVCDFGRSWRSGLAFLALIKSINSELVDIRKSLTRNPQENLQQAFSTAYQSLDIPPLLEPQDVTCSSPDEKSIITYISMFLKHCPDMDEDTSEVPSPHICKFRSLETLVDSEDSQTLPPRFEPSSELLLWKRWSRRSSVGSPTNQQNLRKSSTVFPPPSPLDANVANPEIRLWLEKSLDHGYSKTRADEILFSLSSEEGVYSLTPLDSDEEEAYDYILDLNKDVFQTQAKRKVLRVEEETAEELCGQSNVEFKGISWNDDLEVDDDRKLKMNRNGKLLIVEEGMFVQVKHELSGQTLDNFRYNEFDARKKRKVDGTEMQGMETLDEKSFDVEVLQDRQNSGLLDLNKVIHPLAKTDVPRNEEGIIVQSNEGFQGIFRKDKSETEVSLEADDNRKLQINRNGKFSIAEEAMFVQVKHELSGQTLETFQNNGSKIETLNKLNLDGEEIDSSDGRQVDKTELVDKESLKKSCFEGDGKKKIVFKDCQNKNIPDLSKKVCTSLPKVSRIKEENVKEIIVQPNEEKHIKTLDTFQNYEAKAQRNLDFAKEYKEVSQMDKIQNDELVKHVETGSLENNGVNKERNLKPPSNNILRAHKSFEDAKVGNEIGEMATEMDVLTENDGDFNNERTIHKVVDGVRLQTNYYVDRGCKKHNSTKICQECRVENVDKDLDRDQRKTRSPISTIDCHIERNTTSSSSRSSSCSGVILESLATSSGVSRTELEVLLLLWLFFYCCFMGRQLMS